MLRQPMPRGKNDALLFAPSDAGSSAAKIAVAAQAYFDEHQRSAVFADQVDLAAAHPIVVRYHIEPSAQEVSGRDFLRRLAAACSPLA